MVTQRKFFSTLLKLTSSRTYNIAITFLVFCLLLGIAPETKSAESKKILILNSYHKGYLWSDNIISGIESIFAKEAPEVELSFEYMDTKRHATKECFPLLEELYKNKFHFKYDLVIVSDNNALEFLLHRRQQLLPGVPIVFCGINNFNDSMLKGHRNITGVAEDFDLKSTIELALKLHPGTTHIVSISGSTKTAALNLNRLRQIKSDFDDSLTFIELEKLTSAELKKALHELPPDTILLNLSFYRDREGRVFSLQEALALINSNSTMPVYAAWDHNVAGGAMGGIVVSGHLQGTNAAKMALQILHGTPAADIPVIRKSPNIPMFNYAQMQRFNLSYKNLPTGNIVLYEPVTFYFKYRPYIWLTTVFVGLQTLVIIVLLVNIRRRKTAERDLVDSEQRFRGTFEQAAVGIALVATDGRWLRVNQKLCDIVGYSKDEMMGMTFQDITHPDDMETDLQYVKQVLAAEIQTYSMEKRYIRKDLSPVWINLTVSLIRDDTTGEPKYFISIIEDVSSRKDAEKNLKKTHEQLLHAEKLSAIGGLTASIAHEFNNPLQGVMNIIKGVARRATLDEDDAELMTMAVGECNRIRDLIKSLQDFNRPTSGRKAPMDIHAVLDNLLLLGKKEYSTRKIIIEKRYSENMPRIKAVADQLKQVFLNLLNNAADACDGGGTITIKTETLGEKIVVRIHDTGTGITPEDKAHIFEPFFTTKPAIKGTGLGLSVSYGIIKGHGGEITVASEPGKGTTFSVTLPIEGGHNAE
jgi:PAS domain S-box-containing protein